MNRSIGGNMNVAKVLLMSIALNGMGKGLLEQQYNQTDSVFEMGNTSILLLYSCLYRMDLTSSDV